jgi:predicted  nucleic acid-binding Zn-ribbon protein
METDLERLIDNAAACSLSLKGAADDFVKALRGMKAATLKCAEELKAKRAAADEQVDNLRADIQQIRDERSKAERELAIVHREIEKGRKEIERVKDEYRKIINRVLETPTAA